MSLLAKMWWSFYNKKGGGMLIKTRVHEFINQVYMTKRGIWFPLLDLVLPKHNNVLAILRNERGGTLIPAHNIVTDDGDLYYAQRAASETPTNAFGVHELGSAGTPGKTAIRSGFTVIGSTEKAHAATYPKTNDGDADNTGAGADIVTYLASYTKADFNANGITHGWITNVTPAAGEKLLTGYAFAASFNKTANDTLKIFVNHTMNGI